MKNRIILMALSFLIFQTQLAQASSTNSNMWPVYRNERFGFHISYPADWVFPPIKGKTVQFSVSPPEGSGNCNILISLNSGLSNLSQSQLNQETDETPLDDATFAYMLGLPVNQVRVKYSSREKIGDVSAILATVETKLNNLEGAYFRTQKIVIATTPGKLWSMNCGASNFSSKEATRRFEFLQPVFMKILGTFGFEK